MSTTMPNRRWFQFSLPTLMVGAFVTAFIALACVFVWLVGDPTAYVPFGSGPGAFHDPP